MSNTWPPEEYRPEGITFAPPSRARANLRQFLEAYHTSEISVTTLGDLQEVLHGSEFDVVHSLAGIAVDASQGQALQHYGLAAVYEGTTRRGDPLTVRTDVFTYAPPRVVSGEGITEIPEPYHRPRKIVMNEYQGSRWWLPAKVASVLTQRHHLSLPLDIDEEHYNITASMGRRRFMVSAGASEYDAEQLRRETFEGVDPQVHSLIAELIEYSRGMNNPETVAGIMDITSQLVDAFLDATES